MELVSTKILVLTLLGVIRLFFGLVPLKITKKLRLWGDSGVSHKLIEERKLRVETAISLCLCFGGGVLLATCFIHMIPEVRESLEAVKRNGSALIPQDTSFPLAELFVCCGFFLVYVIEEVAHRLFLHSGHKDTISPPQQCCSTIETELKKTEESTGEKFTSQADTVSMRSRPRTGSKIAPASSQVHLIASSLSLERNCHPCDGATSVESAHHHHSGFALHSLNEDSMVGNVRRFLVVIALSFHSVFEGLAIGLQQTQRDVWYLFTAVSIHACAILFCIGLELVTSGVRVLNLVLYIVILSLVSPLGVMIGILVTGAVEDLMVAVLQGIAGGTILYITFFEVLDREKRKETGCGIMRIFFILLGFSVMVALQAFGGHDHSNNEGHDHANASHQHHHHHLEHDHDHKR